ncbi:MAG: hypothetical protein HRT87_06625 [Legionellales bacterium]|nr:hypothetical protein [Legionellales bacterium]
MSRGIINYYFDQEKYSMNIVKQKRSNVITTNHFILNVYKFLLQFKNKLTIVGMLDRKSSVRQSFFVRSETFAPLITPKTTWRLCKWKNIKRRSLWLLESTINHRIWLLTGNFCKKVTLFDNCIQFVRRGLAMCVAAKHCIYFLLSGMIRVILGHLRIHIFNFTEAFSFKESSV